MAIGIISLDPPAGTLNANPETARWTPVVATIEVEAGQVPYVGIKIGNLWWDVYDGHDAAFSPFFREHSAIASAGVNQYKITILPNGGWWRSQIDLRLRTGVELS